MRYGRQSDSQSEIERLMEQYGSSLLRMSALYLKDASLAQDAVQETFLKAYRCLENYRGESSEKTWLTTICINTCRLKRANAILQESLKEWYYDEEA